MVHDIVIINCGLFIECRVGPDEWMFVSVQITAAGQFTGKTVEQNSEKWNLYRCIFRKHVS
jgi:hypothetical protein